MNKTFFLDLTINNPIIKNHTIFGQSLMPGLAYIDLLYQLAINELNPECRNYSINKMFILKPLILSKEEAKKIKIVFTKKHENWMISVEDAESDTKKDGNVYISAELHKSIISFDMHLDINALITKSTKKTDLEDIYSKARQRDLVHKEIIKAEGSIYISEDDFLIDILNFLWQRMIVPKR
ncbi:MAG: polyketide synthase dehydratase domain-containing protein [Candidatus Pacearchaeota archaeon]|nr:polyketide synthase dehydratase domain-containing protein [Candidatus Pacearchaeota archaeon]